MRNGLRWNTDPKPTVGISPYATFNGNPIFNADPLGDSTGDPIMPRHPIKSTSDAGYLLYNGIGSIVNSGQSLLSKAGDYLKNPVDQLNNDAGALKDAVAGQINYFTTTPSAQLKADAKAFFSNPDNYFHAAEDAFATIAVGKFSIPGEVPPVPKIRMAEDFSLRGASAELTNAGDAIAESPINLRTSSQSMAPSRTYTIYNSFGELHKFGVTDAGFARMNQSLREAGSGSSASWSGIMPKFQAHISEKYLRSLHYNSTDQWALPGMKVPYPVDFSTGLTLKPKL